MKSLGGEKGGWPSPRTDHVHAKCQIILHHDTVPAHVRLGLVSLTLLIHEIPSFSISTASWNK
jgi:hypothetical protein